MPIWWAQGRPSDKLREHTITQGVREEITNVMFRLDGQVALVTGAGRGLGAGTAVALSEAGAELVLLSRTCEELEEVAKRIAAKNGRARVLACDVTDGSKVRSEIARIEQLDILINNAGSRGFGASERLTWNFANFDESTLNLVTGESGIFLSPFYMDQWEAW